MSPGRCKVGGKDNIRPVKADVSKMDSIKKLMKGMDVAVGACPIASMSPFPGRR